MSDQQSEEKAPKRRAGSISRYTTLGSGKTSERQSAETSRSADSQVSEGSNVGTSKSLDTQGPEPPDVETSRSRNAQELENPNVQELGRQDTQDPKRSGVRTAGKRERHTIYLPPDLSEWVKIKAIKTKREISEVVTEAVERYREEEGE